MGTSAQNADRVLREGQKLPYKAERFHRERAPRSPITHNNYVQKPLSKAPRSLLNIMMTLQRYNFKLQCKRKKQIYLADMLSRAPEESNYEIYEVEEINEESNVNPIESLTESDIIVERIRRAAKDLTEEIMRRMIRK
ncbi:hypothetical protein ILUMI_00523 [Ignelater luminosus]|uniref:Uncharacterized protein n=1 Tax=Ignelater luminosus TaxID=2038154 RepID=A0A8K0GN16_IGNLU|nr:hypothetical protein ILUMI_00523 [Ignelater luminosus]